MKSFIVVALVVALAALVRADIAERREREIENTKAEAINIEQIVDGFSDPYYSKAQTFFKGVHEAHNFNVMQAAAVKDISTELEYIANLLVSYELFEEAFEALLANDQYASSAYMSDKGFHHSVEHIKRLIKQRRSKLAHNFLRLRKSSA